MAIFKKIRDGKAWNGDWWIGYKDAQGKRHRERVGTSYTLAKEVLTKRQNDAVERRNFPGRAANGVLFSVVADKFWQLHGQHLSKNWRYILAALVKRFGGRRIGQISTGDIQAFYNEYASKGRPGSPSTANRYLTHLSSIFNRAKHFGDFYGENPCAAIKKKREPNHRVRYLSLEEMDRLSRAIHPRLRPIVACAIMTGMRRGELLGLVWQNINLERRVIHILKSKSGRSREIPIAGALWKALVEFGVRPAGVVFNLPAITLRRHFHRALRDAHIESFRFHDLRHTFASHFIMRTGDLIALQRLLGHSSLTQTQKYAHLSQAHMAKGMALFEAGMPLLGAVERGEGARGKPASEPHQLGAVQ